MARWNPMHWIRRRTRDANTNAAPRAAADYLAAEAAAERAEQALLVHDHAEARSAIRQGHHLAPQHPRLRELSARLAMADGHPELAVRLLDADPKPNAKRRLLLALAQCQAGRRLQAELQLRKWNRDPQCPSEGRALLAWLELEKENAAAARRVLTPNLRHGPDALTCQMLLMMDIAEQLPRATRKAVAYLSHAFCHDPHIARWLDSFHIAPKIDHLEAPLELIERLAEQLLERPHMIRSLIVAQQHRPSLGRIDLLRRALVRIVDRLAEPVIAVESLARLAHIAGDIDEARRWTRHGLKLEPYSASLALLLDQLADADQADDVSPRPLQVLRRAVAAKPQYSDLRRALILRYQKAGLSAQASRNAQRWIKQQPDNALAMRTYTEIVAPNLEQAA